MFRPYLSTFPETEDRVYFDACQAKISSEFSVQSDIQTEVWNGFGRNSFVVAGQRVGTHTITLPVTYTAAFDPSYITARAEVNENIQRIEYAMHGKFTMNIGDGYVYQCALTGKSKETWLGDFRCDRTYTISAVRTKGLITQQFSFADADSVNVICDSTVPKTDCRITIDGFYTDISRKVFTIGGLTFDSDYAYAGPFVIDGINKVIQAEGKNVSSYFLWTDFPYLVPGDNIATVKEGAHNTDGVFFTVEYYQTFL